MQTKSDNQIRTFKDLKVWQKSHYLALEIYRATKGFPRHEKFGIVSQLRRAVVSVATNIVEGYKRRSRKDFLHFLNIADTSLEETKYLIILSGDLSYIDEGETVVLISHCEEIGKMLNGLQRSLQNG